MSSVLIKDGSAGCAHGASITLSGSAKLTVNGAPVMLETDATSWAFDAKCAQKDASSGQIQCSLVASVTGGQSQKLTVGGKKVLLDSFTAQSNGKPDNSVSAMSAGQSKLTAK